MKLTVMRHGHTNYNELELCNDDPGKDVYLTATGIAQATTAQQQLASVDFDQIFVSELPRTYQTADIVRGDRSTPITTHPCLNDIRSGFDSLPVKDYFAATGHDRLHVRANGGESVLDYKARVAGFIDWLKTQSWQSVLIVAHEETLRVFHAHFHQLSDEAMLDLHFGNCEIMRYRLNEVPDS